jgi:arylsulfatase A-like enzyme
MTALKENGLDQNTLVMFTSDNGGAGYIGLPNVNVPYRGWKITLFEGGIRVPFLARWPAQLPAGVTYEAPVHHFDMYATAAAAGNTDLPSDRVMDGVNLTPYVTGIDTSTPHDYLFFSSGAAQAVRDMRWKLIVSAPQGGKRKEWLFDLKADGERKNLLAQNSDVASRLRDALAKHKAEQAESRWPWGLTTAINVDRDMAKPDQPEDEFAYWSN